MPNSESIWQKLQNKLRIRYPAFTAKLPAFIQLTRFDRPIGTFLLLWPTITALWIAAKGYPDFSLILIFVLGTTIMRAAGCAVNDVADYKIDGHVNRTENRPLQTGALTRNDALACFAVLSVMGFGLVLLTNTLTIQLSFGAIAVIAIYPFMKRFTNLPQLVLGVAFSWGILMAFSAQTNSIPPSAFLLFVANTVWTVAYDTQYAMVDRAFDKQIGVKSTAILFGEADKLMIGLLQGMFIAAMWLAGARFELGTAYYLSLLAATALLAYQQYLIKDRTPGLCFRAFLNNNWIGALIFLGVFLSYL